MHLAVSLLIRHSPPCTFQNGLVIASAPSFCQLQKWGLLPEVARPHSLMALEWLLVSTNPCPSRNPHLELLLPQMKQITAFAG
jgi:hypothetical protein